MLGLLLSRINSCTLFTGLILLGIVWRMTSFSSFLLFLQAVIVVGRCVENEREALLKFREGLIDHSGRLSSWDGKNCCNWTGVSCSNKTGNVFKLDLKSPSFMCHRVNSSYPTPYYSKCLLGKLNAALINLTYLNYLDLSRNNFGPYPIPSFISSLKNLRYLDLSYASFHGMIPPDLGNLSNLIHLDLSSYLYSNSRLWVSDFSWISNLHSLEYLGLAGANLSKVSSNWLKEVNKLHLLLELHLSGTELTELPQSLPIINITSITDFDLSNNLFNSPFPRWIFNISTLVSLRLDRCNLTGKILELSQESLCNLQVIDLSFNDLSGQIKEFVDSISACQNNSLKEIHFSYNKFVGDLPDTLGLLSNLKSLNLNQNLFSGKIPRSIGNLSSLFSLDVSFNIMTGNIPETTGQLNQLAFLLLYGNSWEGTMTETCFQNLTRLYGISLSSASHSLSVNVRPDWIPPFNLSYIFIDYCQVGPMFPLWLRTQNQISRVSLSNTALSGSIPDWFWTLSTNLFWLDLSDNMLAGKLPTWIRARDTGAWIDLGFNRLEGPLPLWPTVAHLSLRNNSLSGPIPANIGKIMLNLKNIDLSNNMFNGSIPHSMNELQDLRFLDLSSNYLSGNIPSAFQGLQRLRVLDLSKNNLSGDIPSSICSLSSLWWLKLSSNNLSGKVSSTLENCTALFSIDLGYNRLTGTLSEWIGDKLLPLSYIGLRANMLNGEIPEQICNFPNLHALDLADNNLSGSIPKCLGKKLVWKSLRYLFIPSPDTMRIEFLQRAELVVKGRRNEYTKTFFLVNSLDLSDNNLSGEIPEELTRLSALGTLNLSWNQLSGKIPESIGGMRWLESLDLSFNHLSGHIPPSMASLTSLSYLNLSYNNLSGPIPTANQFQTFKDTSFVGNSELCGPPLLTKCFTPNEIATTGPDDEVGSKDDDTVWFYACIAFGFVFGFWVVCGTLAINKCCRIAYFKFVDQMSERISLVISLWAIRLRRKFMWER